jgi:hypothetical protein
MRATPASADILELHGVVTSAGRESDVPLDQPVSVRVRMDRQVPHEAQVIDPYLLWYVFDEPTDDSASSCRSTATACRPSRSPARATASANVQGQSASLLFEGLKGTDVHRVQLFFHTNFANDALDPTLELTDYAITEFLVSDNGVERARGTFQWARSVSDERVLLEELGAAIDDVAASVSDVATSVATRASQATLLQLGQALLANQANLFANQATILANQATINGKLDRILRRLQ